MNPRSWKRTWSVWRWRCLLAVGVLCLLLATLPPPAPLVTSARYPLVAPRQLAHKLADFSTHLLLYPRLGEWSLEEESSNYTAWRYSVSYSCGARCTGRARVLAVDRRAPHAPEHEAPSEHLVLVAHRACTQALLLPWPDTCDEWETETVIVSDGVRGSVVRETARATCPALRRLVPGGCARRLRAARDQHFHTLRALLAGAA
ncbi:hypothetical protein NE865_15858 [Phthorimaea operculella]|nr:hypothetical protein NE865_15858 [Phthorimaea operculella]